MALSMQGISAMILSSLNTYRNTDYCTINDCKLVLNNLIRNFRTPLRKEKRHREFWSINAFNKDIKYIKDHAIPVMVLMDKLFAWDNIEMNADNIKSISDFLEFNLVIVKITEEEDHILNSSGFQRKMPSEYFDRASELYNDLWARYKVTELFKNILT